jgi:Flp pilus assembly protein TadD
VTGERTRSLIRDGLAAAQGGDLGTAERLLGRAAEADPGDPDAWNHLGVVLTRQGESTRGIQAFRRALRLRPAHAEAHRNLAVALDRQGREREAVRHYRAFLAAADLGDPRRDAVGRRLQELGPAARGGE